MSTGPLLHRSGQQTKPRRGIASFSIVVLGLIVVVSELLLVIGGGHGVILAQVESRFLTGDVIFK